MFFHIQIKVGDDNNKLATGFLAETASEYAAAMESIFSMSETEKTCIRKNGRKHASEHFSEELFCNRFILCLKPILKLKKYD